MESKVIFTLTWHGSVREEHVSLLENAGLERAYEMLKEGYSQGELVEDLPYETNSGKEKEKHYTGWWSIKFEQN